MSDETPRIRRALYDNLAAGRVERAGETPDGDEKWKLTAEGKEHVDALIDSYIAGHGDEAAVALAEALSLPLHIAEELVALRRAASEPSA